MAKFEFGFEETWFRLIIKKLPDNPDLFQPKLVEKAQSILRVGKLKVGAAKVWAETARIIHKKKQHYFLTPLGRLIAHHDPDFEEDGIWQAIHYNLACKESAAWFYAFYFNEFELDRFDRDTLEKQMRACWDQNNDKPMTDNVFNKLIFAPFKQVLEGTRLGDGFGFFKSSGNNEYFRLPIGTKTPPMAIFAYALLDWAKQRQRLSVHLEILLQQYGIGKIFRLNRGDLDILLIEIGEQYEKQVGWISHTAGLNSISMMDLPPLALISAYYHQLDGNNPITALNRGVEEIRLINEKPIE